MKIIKWNKQLLHAANTDNILLMKEALSNGANINTSDSNEDTALIRSAVHGHIKCLNYLLHKKVNIESKNSKGATALMKAAFWGRTDCLKSLLSAHADIYATDPTGHNAVMHAQLWKRIDCIKVLIDFCPDIIDKKNNKGQTVLDLSLLSSAKYHSTEQGIVEALIMSGANIRYQSSEFKEKYASSITSLKRKKAHYRQIFNRHHNQNIKIMKSNVKKYPSPILKRRPKP